MGDHCVLELVCTFVSSFFCPVNIRLLFVWDFFIKEGKDREHLMSRPETPSPVSG